MNVGEGRTQCFWLEPTGKVELSLRRFTFGLSKDEEPRSGHRVCTGQPKRADGYRQGCDASVRLGVEVPIRMSKPDEYGYRVMKLPLKKHCPAATDKRWPRACEICGKPFKRGDVRQVNQSEVYIRSDTGAKVAFRGYGDKSMAGALFDMWWRKNYVVIDDQGVERTYVGPDGIALVAVCPNGLSWEVDGPATGGGGWTRTGDPRKPETLSVTPSIVAGKAGEPTTYHGFLTAGWFTDHVG